MLIKIFSSGNPRIHGFTLPKGTFLNSWIDESYTWIVELTPENKYRIFPNTNHTQLLGKYHPRELIFDTLEEAEIFINKNL